jgi:hypothetical protein
LLIDDIVLYDAAPPGEKRPFPKRIVFTAGFDSGKQGKEWPGKFEIAANRGYFWHAAKSVVDPDSGLPHLLVGMRGERSLDESAHLSFRYRVTGTDSLRVRLGKDTTVELKNLSQGKWAEATVDFSTRARKGDRVDEVRFLLPKGAELFVDDLLLYTPGK